MKRNANRKAMKICLSAPGSVPFLMSVASFGMLAIYATVPQMTGFEIRPMEEIFESIVVLWLVGGGFLIVPLAACAAGYGLLARRDGHRRETRRDIETE